MCIRVSSTAVVFDVTGLFVGDNKLMDPFDKYSANMSRGRKRSTSFQSSKSFVDGFKAFKDNISCLLYTSMGFECVDKLSIPEENTEFSGDILPSDGAEVYLRTDLALAPIRAYTVSYTHLIMILALFSNSGLINATEVGKRTDALEASAWNASQWISAVDAPVVKGHNKDVYKRQGQH